LAASAASCTISSLDVSLPSSTVTLAASGEEVTYESVTASTADNTLKVGKGVTINKLKVKKGNIRVKEGANVESITRESNSDETTTVFIETGATVGNLSSLEADTSFTIVKSGDSELVSYLYFDDYVYDNETYDYVSGDIQRIYCKLYKTYTNDGESYTIKNLIEGYDFDFTLNDNGYITATSGSWYGSYWYFGPDTWNSSYSVLRLNDEDYYGYNYCLWAPNGTRNNALYFNADKSVNYGVLTMYMEKYDYSTDTCQSYEWHYPYLIPVDSIPDTAD
jgi:uncharacterized Zn ribbon protein